MKKTLSILILSLGCVPVQSTVKQDRAPAEVQELTIPAIPEWTDRYADGKKGDVRFFNLTKVMAKYKVNRLHAVEIQNTYRDLTRANPTMDLGEALRQAVSVVNGGQWESGVDLSALSKAKFIVVFDLDDTLYDQYYRGGDACNTVAFKRPNGKMKYIQMVPGWAEIIKTIHRLGGRTILFSANLDDRTILNLKHIKIDGTPLTESPLISGVMTNSHLTQQEKTEPPGSLAKPRKGRPVIEPSKDLRHFDPTLQRVIIVDDNPLRLSQFRNIRVFKKFHADNFCTTKDAVLKAAYKAAMPTVAQEIEEAAAYMTTHPGVSFVQAYLPYSSLGRVATEFIAKGRDWTLAQARDYILQHPDAVDKRF